MRVFLALVLWCLLLVLCWPLALVMLGLFPVIWLIALPFRLAASVGSGLIAFLGALLHLPARLLGSGPRERS